MNNLLALDKLEQASVNRNYFPYCEVDDFIRLDFLPQVLQDFPDISVRGSIPPNCLKYGANFQMLLDALHSDELHALIEKKFLLTIPKNVMITVRAHTNRRDGYIHTDTPSKIITMLLYLNNSWSHGVGNLRLLRSGNNLNNYFAEIAPVAGKLVVFQVTNNCWHGHYPFIGRRQALQINYMANQDVIDKEYKRHRRSYVMKNLFTKFMPKM